MPWMQQGIGNDKWKLHQRYVGGTIHQHHTLKSESERDEERKMKKKKMNKNNNKNKKKKYRTEYISIQHGNATNWLKWSLITTSCCLHLFRMCVCVKRTDFFVVCRHRQGALAKGRRKRIGKKRWNALKWNEKKRTEI